MPESFIRLGRRFHPDRAGTDSRQSRDGGGKLHGRYKTEDARYLAFSSYFAATTEFPRVPRNSTPFDRNAQGWRMILGPRHCAKTRFPCGFPRPGAPEAAFFKGFLRFSLALTCPLRYSVPGAAPERVSGKLARRWHPLLTRRHNLDVKADEQVEDRGVYC